MRLLLPIAIFVIGILVMFRVISTRNAGKYLLWIGLAFVFGPIVYGIARANATGFISEKHPWWVYIIAFFVVLVLLRGLLNFIFPWRRR